MPLTLDQILTDRLRLWFPGIDAPGIDVFRIREDMNAFAVTIKQQMADQIEALPRYEPELAETSKHKSKNPLARAEAVEAYEARMVAKPQGQPASFVAIQDVRRLVNG